VPAGRTRVRKALETNARFEHRPELLRTRIGRAAALKRLGLRREASEELGSARQEAEALGMLPLVSLAGSLANS
jgi:hypothetical protein